jgi:hypothetical protein
LNILAEPFWVQKRGCSPEEYEDAACPSERSESSIRFAVADGATESIFARRWAEQLVAAVGNGDLSPRSLNLQIPHEKIAVRAHEKWCKRARPVGSDKQDWLEAEAELRSPAAGISRLRASWHEWLSGKTLPWFAEEKARQGSFAALLALEFSAENAGEAPGGCWHAAAVGDSCLFHIRGEDVLFRFPLTHAEAFDSRPYLLSSIGADQEQIGETISTGTWRSGDFFYLMTDALSCWFLKHIDSGGSPSILQADFASTNGMEPFWAWVESLRDQGLIRNDDCTLIRVVIR